MQDWGRNIKKRRAEQLRLIQQGVLDKDWNPTLTTPAEVVPWTQQSLEKPTKKKYPRFLLQLCLAVTLFVVTSMAIRYPHTQQWVHQVWVQDFEFEKISSLYEEYVKGGATILPTFSKTDETEPGWSTPIQGKVILPFDKNRKGIVIQTNQDSPMVAAKEGWVVYVGKREGLSHVVVVRHKDGKETWYGFLDQVSLKINDWVKQGSEIGTIKKTKDSYLAYFAIKDRDQFLNPTDVIPFD